MDLLADPVPVRLTVALLVNQTCQAARDRRHNRSRGDASPRPDMPTAPVPGPAQPRLRTSSKSPKKVSPSSPPSSSSSSTTPTSLARKEASCGSHEGTVHSREGTKTSEAHSSSSSSSSNRKVVRGGGRPSSRGKKADANQSHSTQAVAELIEKALLSSDTAIELFHDRLLSLKHEENTRAVQPSEEEAARVGSDLTASALLSKGEERSPRPPPKPPKKPSKILTSQKLSTRPLKPLNPFDEDDEVAAPTSISGSSCAGSGPQAPPPPPPPPPPPLPPRRGD